MFQAVFCTLERNISLRDRAFSQIAFSRGLQAGLFPLTGHENRCFRLWDKKRERPALAAAAGNAYAAGNLSDFPADRAKARRLSVSGTTRRANVSRRDMPIPILLSLLSEYVFFTLALLGFRQFPSFKKYTSQYSS